MFYSIDPCWHSGKQQFPKFDNVVVIGTYNRAHLLLRSLFHYQAAKRPQIAERYVPEDWECWRDATLALVIIDDGSTDYTEELCRKFANPDLPIFYFKLTDKEPGTWRDSAAFINMGISFAIHALGAIVVMPTHPEICVGETTISDIVSYVTENSDSFGLAKGYYLTPEQQERYGLDSLALMNTLDGKMPIDNQFRYWMKTETFIQQTPDFYNYGDPTHAYHHSQVEKAKTWDSWIFCAASRETWLKFKGLGESSKWGSVDLVFHWQRYHFGFATWTPDAKSSMVVHENHDDPNINTPTPRDLDLAHNEASLHQFTLEEKPNYLNPERWTK